MIVLAAFVLSCDLMLDGLCSSAQPCLSVFPLEAATLDESVRTASGAVIESGESVTPDSEQVVRQPAGPPPTPQHTGIKAMIKGLGTDFTHLPSKENLFWVSVGGGLALAVHPADQSVNEAMVNSDFAHDFFKFGSYLGELYTLLPAAATVYAVGRVKDEPKVSRAPRWEWQDLVPVRSRIGYVCVCDGVGAAPRVEGGSPRVYLLVLCRHFTPARQQALAQRCRVRLKRGHHRRANGDTPRS